jgi:hypothetical protein
MPWPSAQFMNVEMFVEELLQSDPLNVSPVSPKITGN